jgi:hypothetical protein
MVPPGRYVAVCRCVAFVGDLQDDRYGKAKPKIVIGFYLPSLAGQNRDSLWRSYNMSFDDRAGLPKLIRDWRGRDFTGDDLLRFELADLAGKPAVVTVAMPPGAKLTNLVGIEPWVPSAGEQPPKLPDSPFVWTIETLYETGIPENAPAYVMRMLEKSAQYREWKRQQGGQP